MIESAEQVRALRESEHPHEYHRAAHEDAPLEVWLDVIHRMPEMRFWVAQNKTVPTAVLERLADDEDSRVRFMVASKRKLPESLQVKLANDAHASVRSALARNKKATEQVLAVLMNDCDEVVRDAARRQAKEGS